MAQKRMRDNPGNDRRMEAFVPWILASESTPAPGTEVKVYYHYRARYEYTDFNGNTYEGACPASGYTKGEYIPARGWILDLPENFDDRFKPHVSTWSYF